MRRYALRIFSFVLLGLAFLVWPRATYSGENVEIIIPDRTRVADPFPNTSSTSGEQLGYRVSNSPPGALVPIPGALSSCPAAGGGVIDPRARFVLATDSARNSSASRATILRRVP